MKMKHLLLKILEVITRMANIFWMQDPLNKLLTSTSVIFELKL